MDHPCSDEGLESNRIECTKFCEGCTKHSKVHFEVGIGSQSLPYGFQNEIMDHPCSDGGPKNNRIGCTKFCEGCTKLLEDVPRVPNSVPRWENTSNHLFHMNVNIQPFKLSACLHLPYCPTRTSNLVILKACL